MSGYHGPVMVPRCFHGLPLFGATPCEACAAEREERERAHEVATVVEVWGKIPSVRRRWFDGCAFCTMPLGEHDNVCAFRMAIR